MDKKEFKDIRIKLGMSQKQLASTLNRSLRSIANLEKGENKISLELATTMYALSEKSAYTQTNTNIKGGTQVNNVKGDLNVKSSEDYFDKLEEKQRYIKSLERIIKSLEDNLKSKDEMIDLYKKLLEK